MNKKISLGAAITYMAIIAAIVYSLTSINSADVFNEKMNEIENRQKTYDKLAEIDRWVRDNYYGETDDTLLLENAAEGFIAGLGDEYSRYLSAEEYQTYKNVSSEKYIGIGVETEMSEEGFILISAVYPDSPAQYANIMPGDILVEVDGVAVTQENYNELSKSLKGKTGTKVTVLKRSGAGDEVVELIRRDVDVPTVELTMMEDKAYFRFFGVSSATAKQLDKAVVKAIADGATALIVDMRGVKSTSVAYVADMIDIFTGEGDSVFALYGDGTKEVLATSDNKSITIPVMVLADEKTAGTTELFVQSIKEMDNGGVVGTTTKGYGSMQKDYKLSDGSAVILTTALYTTASGESYDKLGIVPTYDIKWSGTDEEKAMAMGRPETDPQLRKAIDVTAVTTVVK